MTVPALALDNITCTFASRDDRTQRYTAVKDTTLHIAPGGLRVEKLQRDEMDR